MDNRRGHQCGTPYLVGSLSFAFKPEISLLLPMTSKSLSKKNAGTEADDA